MLTVLKELLHFLLGTTFHPDTVYMYMGRCIVQANHVTSSSIHLQEIMCALIGDGALTWICYPHLHVPCLQQHQGHRRIQGTVLSTLHLTLCPPIWRYRCRSSLLPQ